MRGSKRRSSRPSCAAADARARYVGRHARLPPRSPRLPPRQPRRARRAEVQAPGSPEDAEDAGHRSLEGGAPQPRRSPPGRSLSRLSRSRRGGRRRDPRGAPPSGAGAGGDRAHGARGHPDGDRRHLHGSPRGERRTLPLHLHARARGGRRRSRRDAEGKARRRRTNVPGELDLHGGTPRPGTTHRHGQPHTPRPGAGQGRESGLPPRHQRRHGRRDRCPGEPGLPRYAGGHRRAGEWRLRDPVDRARGDPTRPRAGDGGRQARPRPRLCRRGPPPRREGRRQREGPTARAGPRARGRAHLRAGERRRGGACARALGVGTRHLGRPRRGPRGREYRGDATRPEAPEPAPCSALPGGKHDPRRSPRRGAPSSPRRGAGWYARWSRRPRLHGGQRHGHGGPPRGGGSTSRTGRPRRPRREGRSRWGCRWGDPAPASIP